MFANKEKVIVREVGLRDGLQSIDKIVPTPTKLEWLAAAYNAGLREIEVGSFVPARLLPQMADTAAVVKAARNFEDLVVTQPDGAETEIRGMMDQAALHGVFNQIRDLGLDIISVQRFLEPNDERTGA